MVDSLPNEQWLPIAGLEDRYAVSNNGRVLALERRIHYAASPQVNRRAMYRVRREHLMGTHLNTAGYKTVKLATASGPANFPIHILVCSAFNGPPPQDGHCRHLDDNKEINTPDNLRWGSLAENEEDRVRNDRIPRGEAHGRAKLTEKDVRDMRCAHSAGTLASALAVRYGISEGHAYNIVLRKRWAHIL